MEEKMNYKIILIGDGGVGKTTYAKFLLEGKFHREYIPTLGVDVHPIVLNTTEGNITINVWDCSGEQKFSGLGTGYWLGADGAILMFAKNSVLTMRNVSRWKQQVMETIGNVPVCICRNKDELEERAVPDFPFVPISVREGHGIYQPVLELLRKIRNNPELDLA